MHLINHMDGKPYHCAICRKTFSTSKHLVIHMKNHSLNKCYTCMSGNFDFTCLTQLRMHLITHMDGKATGYSTLQDIHPRGYPPWGITTL